jgi:beta-lactamase regulating signal transducer with metallopeptidase domain
MTPPFTQNHHLEAVGWTLIHFCWQAGAIAAVYKVIDLSATRNLASRATSHARYLFALVAMLGMFGAASGTLLYEELRLQRATLSITADKSVTWSEESASQTLVLPASIQANATTLRSGIAAALPRTEVLLPWVDGLWMLGVLALSIRTIGGWWLIQRLRRSAIQQVPPGLAARFADLSQRIGIQSRVVLRVSSRIASPLAVGMFRSLILLPASALTTLSAEQLEAVLAHELAHIRRADYLWNILQTMIETLFFFHPAVWYVGANLRQQRELCCDDIAIASSDPVIYATALLALEEHRARIISLNSRGNGLPLALALDGHQSRFTLLSRIARILGEPMEPSTSTRALTPFSILGVCAALAFFAIPIPQVLASLRPTAPVPPAPVTQPIPAAPIVASAPATPEPAQSPEALPAPATPAKPAVSVTPVSPRTAVVPAPIAAPEAAAMPAPVAAPISRTSTLGIEIIRAIGAATRIQINANTNINPNVKMVLAELTSQVVPPAPAATSNNATAPRADYITQMQAAGYHEDIDHYMAMKIQGITPEYARDMAQVGFGKPSASELTALKIHGVTPAYLSELKAAGLKPENFQEVISYRIFRITPEYIAGMKAAGFPDLPAKKLVELRTQDITPEFARTAKQQFPDITTAQLVKLRIFHIDDAFITKAKSLGLTPLTIDKLVQLRNSGLIEDSASIRFNRDVNRDQTERQLARDKAQEERQKARDSAQRDRDKADREREKLWDKQGDVPVSQ